MIDWTWHIALPNLFITTGLVWWVTWWVKRLLERERQNALIAAKEQLPPAIVAHLFNHEQIKEMQERIERLEGQTNYLDERLDLHLKGLRGGTGEATG